MKATHIDPLHLVAVKAVQREVLIAQQNHDKFMTLLFERYELDRAKEYHFAEDGLITEVPKLAEVRKEVQAIYDKGKHGGKNGNR